MILEPEISRDTWFFEGKYLMRATAKFLQQGDARRRDVVKACASIFDGHPAITNKPPLFVSSTHTYSSSLNIPLAEAEELGRIFISGLQ
jgi:hypothetical protein